MSTENESGGSDRRLFTGSRWGWKVGDGGRRGWAVLLKISPARVCTHARTHRTRRAAGNPGSGKQLNKFACIYFSHLQSEFLRAGISDVRAAKLSRRLRVLLHFLADVKRRGRKLSRHGVSRRDTDASRVKRLFRCVVAKSTVSFPEMCRELDDGGDSGFENEDQGTRTRTTRLPGVFTLQ